MLGIMFYAVYIFDGSNFGPSFSQVCHFILLLEAQLRFIRIGLQNRI